MLNVVKAARSHYFKARKTVRQFCRDDSATTAIEYCFVAGLIGAVLLLAILALGTSIRDDLFGAINNAWDNGDSVKNNGDADEYGE